MTRCSTNTALLLLLCLPAAVKSQGRIFGDGIPMTNEGLQQAASLWTGTDHNRAEITALKGPITAWDTSQVTTMAGLFRGAALFDEDLSRWNTTSVTDMSDMFNGCSSFRGLGDFDQWDTSRVTTMVRMFKSASSLASVDFSAFTTIRVTDMSDMFSGATFLQGNGMSTWDVSNVAYFNSMFARATNFNADISVWKLQAAKFMEGMFESAVSFNQDLSDWNPYLSGVTSMDGLLENAANFQQSLCWTDLTASTTSVSNLFCGAHPAAHLDPCCASADLIGAACCSTGGSSGSCDTYCRADTGESSVGGISNEDDSIVNDNQGGLTDDGVTVDGAVVVTVTVFNTTDEGVYLPSLGLDDNSTDGGNTVAVSKIEGEENEDGSDSESESLWQQHVWLRILVYIVIVLVAIMLFMYFLQKSGNRRRSSQQISNGLQAAYTQDEESGEECVEVTTDGGDIHTTKLYENDLSTVQTKPTDDDK